MWLCWWEPCANEVMSSVPRRADSLVHGPPVDPPRVTGHQWPSGEESTQILHCLWEKNNSQQMPWVDLDHGSGPRGDKTVPQRLEGLPADCDSAGLPGVACVLAESASVRGNGAPSCKQRGMSSRNSRGWQCLFKRQMERMLEENLVEFSCMLSHFSHVGLFATPWTVACQAPRSTGFSRQEWQVIDQSSTTNSSSYLWEVKGSGHCPPLLKRVLFILRNICSSIGKKYSNVTILCIPFTNSKTDYFYVTLLTSF